MVVLLNQRKEACFQTQKEKPKREIIIKLTVALMLRIEIDELYIVIETVSQSWKRL